MSGLPRQSPGSRRVSGIIRDSWRRPTPQRDTAHDHPGVSSPERVAAEAESTTIMSVNVLGPARQFLSRGSRLNREIECPAAQLVGATLGRAMLKKSSLRSGDRPVVAKSDMISPTTLENL